MSFTPLDILFLVLAFCALWLSAALFWIVWQVGSILRSVNDTLELAQEKISRIESAITSIKSRFESIASASGLLTEGLKRIFEFAMEKRAEHAEANRRAAPKRRSIKTMMDEEDEA